MYLWSSKGVYTLFMYILIRFLAVYVGSESQFTYIIMFIMFIML